MMKNASSRVFHSILVIPCVFLCIVSVISFGSFASEHDKIRESVKSEDRHGDYCILYVESKGKNSGLLKLGHDRPCIVAIWGEVCVFFVGLLLGVLFVVKAVLGIKAISFLSAVVLGIVSLAGLLNFAVAIVITAGLDKTCHAFDRSFRYDQECSEYHLHIRGTSDKYYFYQKINTAKATAWIGTLTLVVMAALQFLLLVIYCYRSQRSQNTVPYGEVENEEDITSEVDTIEKSDKPVLV